MKAVLKMRKVKLDITICDTGVDSEYELDEEDENKLKEMTAEQQYEYIRDLSYDYVHNYINIDWEIVEE
jgi:hypothetical protein